MPCEPAEVSRVFSSGRSQRAWRAPAVLWGTTLLGGWLVCLPRQGSAAEQEPIRLEYVADVGCPSVDEFERMVFARTHSARPALEEEAARLFTVTLQRDHGAFRGSLTVLEGEQSLVRQVNGGNCADLASVLALATALAIDPSADLLPAGTTDSAASAAATANSTQSNSTQPNDVETSGRPANSNDTAPVPPVRATEEPLPYDPPDALPSGSGVELTQLALGPRLEWAATPHLAVGPSLELEFGADGQSWRFGVSASALFTASQRVETARVDFRLITGSLSLCSLAFRSQGGGVHAGPCLQADFGDLYARSSSIPFSESTHRFWSALGVHLRLRANLSEDWNLALAAGPNVILTQYRFEFDDPNTEVYQHGVWTAAGRLLLGRDF